jgi:hypothetical protein
MGGVMHDDYSALHARSVRELARSRGVRAEQHIALLV